MPSFPSNAGQDRLLVTCFSRIIDLEAHHPRKMLKPQQYREYIKCIGKANSFNPFLPDGVYDLDLTQNDDRTVAAMLVKLSAEPGVNWRGETFDGIPFTMGAHWLKARQSPS